MEALKKHTISLTISIVLLIARGYNNNSQGQHSFNADYTTDSIQLEEKRNSQEETRQRAIDKYVVTDERILDLLRDNLDTGTYQLIIKAKMEGGRWQTIELPLSFVAQPVWYQSLIFKVAAILFIAGVGILYYFTMVITVKRRNIKLEGMVKKRTSELWEKNEEIVTQKENIEMQHEQLMAVQSVIEERNRELGIINEDLEKRVCQRTKDLTESNINLQKANEELDTFVYRSYHDIIGPIARIQGLCYTSMLECKDEKTIEYLYKLRDTSDSAKSTLQRVLSIYQIRKHQIQLELIDITEMVHSIIAKMPFEGNSTKLIFYFDTNLPSIIETDVVLVKSIIYNLLDNALRYSKFDISSFVKMTLKKEGQFIIFEFLDNGQGIDALVRDKVFSMFFRGDSKKSGTGLGLYLASITTEKLQGKIIYRNTEDNQSMFQVKLPIPYNQDTDNAQTIGERYYRALNEYPENNMIEIHY